MCKYCNYDPENDVYPEPFAHEELNVLRSCFAFEVEVNRYYKAKELAVTYADIDGSEWSVLISVPINYCPRCGEKLKNKEEQP